MIQNDTDDERRSRCGHNFEPDQCPYAICAYKATIEDLVIADRRIVALEAERDALKERAEKAELAFALQETTLSNESFREALRSELIRINLAENDRLRQALEAAPHGKQCNAVWHPVHDQCGISYYVQNGEFPCNCWKAALARSPEAK